MCDDGMLRAAATRNRKYEGALTTRPAARRASALGGKRRETKWHRHRARRARAPRTSSPIGTGSASCRRRGCMGVDFETRVDFRRLQRYRLARAREALRNSECGALLLFDVNNIRYVSGTKIGEWGRDKFCRFALLTERRRADRLGLRLGGGAPPPLLRLARSRRTAAPACSACAAPSRRASA